MIKEAENPIKDQDNTQTQFIVDLSLCVNGKTELSSIYINHKRR